MTKRKESRPCFTKKSIWSRARRVGHVLLRRVHGQEQGEQAMFYLEEYMAKSKESSLCFTKKNTWPIARRTGCFTKKSTWLRAAYVLLRRVHG